MQQIPNPVPGVPAPESDDGDGVVLLPQAHKQLSDAHYMIVEIHRDYARALGLVRRLAGNDKDVLRGHGFDYEKMLDVQADLLSAGKILGRQLNAIGAIVKARGDAEK